MRYKFSCKHMQTFIWLLLAFWLIADLVIGVMAFRPETNQIAPMLLLGFIVSLSLKYPLLKMLLTKIGQIDHFLYTWAGLMILFPLAAALVYTIAVFTLNAGMDSVARTIMPVILLLLASIPGIVLLFATDRCVVFESNGA